MFSLLFPIEYSSFLFLINNVYFFKVLSFRITVALGIDDISEIEEALIPLLDLCLNSLKRNLHKFQVFLLHHFQ